jgi:hypothetical protein
MHHLDRATRKTERHRPQGTGARPVDQFVSRRGDKPFLQDPFDTHLLSTPDGWQAWPPTQTGD